MKNNSYYKKLMSSREIEDDFLRIITRDEFCALSDDVRLSIIRENGGDVDDLERTLSWFEYPVEVACQWEEEQYYLWAYFTVEHTREWWEWIALTRDADADMWTIRV